MPSPHFSQLICDGVCGVYHTCKHLIVDTIYILDISSDQVNDDDVDEDDGNDDDERNEGVKALFFETVTPGGL